MHKLAEICVRRPVFATVLILVLIVFGVFGYTHMGVDWFPKVDFPVILVTTVWTGTAPEEMETEVSDKIEEQVNTISGIEELRSVSSEGVSRVVVMFALEKDIDVAAQEVRDKINTVMRELPDGVDQPIVSKIDPDASPVLSLAVSGPVSVKEITEYCDKVLRRKLESTPGVGQVMIVGGQPRQINVKLDTLKLRSHNLTVVDVARALQAQNIQIPGGSVKEGPEEFTLRTMGRVSSVKEIQYIPITSRMGHIITIGDIADVEDGVDEPASLAQLDEMPAVLLNIRKQSGTNTIEVVNKVKERFNAITLPQGYKAEIVRDQSVFVQEAVDMVEEHLIIGSIFAAVVVLLFLSNARTTIISALAIPTSIIGAFAVMKYMNFTLNVLTLLALTLSVGIVIDDAIVVLENIFRFIEEKKQHPMEAARAATKEIGLAVVAITLSLIAVFLPIAFMEGIVGRFMWSFGITMATAILISMLVSFSLTPMLASRWLKAPFAKEEEPQPIQDASHHAKTKKSSKQRGVYHSIERGYIALLSFSLRHRWLVVLVMIGCLCAIPFELKIIPKTFTANDDQSEFQMDVRAPEGTSLEATQVVLARLARNIRSMEGIKYTVTSSADTEQHIANLGTIYVKLVDIKERNFSQEEAMEYIRKQILPKYESEKLRVSVQEVSHISAGGSNAVIQYAISGPDMKKLEEYAGKALETLHNFPGAVDIDSSLVIGKPQYGVTVDRAKAADLGVSIADIANTLRLLVAGDKVTDYNEKSEQYEVHVRAQAQFRNDIEELKMVTVPSLIHGTVSLGDIAQFNEGAGPAEINRLGRARQVTVYANLNKGVSMQSALDALDATMKSLNMGSDYKTSLGGQSKEMAKTFKAFFVVFITAFIFIYLVLAAQFESWLHPFTILISLPLTLPFALFSLLVFNQTLNILSLLGVLVLFAVVKKNAILQVDHTNQLREDGLPRWDAIIAANVDRLRPILMTTVAFVAGMLPLLISSGAGAETNRTISSVIVGGQTLSLLLTLVATPVVYSLFDDLSNSRIVKWMLRKS
jgi:HAE1 family hydrophobic/amphiphilic exporter-1